MIGEIVDYKDEIKQLREQGLSLYEIADRLKAKSPEKTERQLWDMAHSATRSRKSMEERPVGVFSDPHIPFNHPNYLQLNQRNCLASFSSCPNCFHCKSYSILNRTAHNMVLPQWWHPCYFQLLYYYYLSSVYQLLFFKFPTIANARHVMCKAARHVPIQLALV